MRKKCNGCVRANHKLKTALDNMPKWTNYTVPSLPPRNNASTNVVKANPQGGPASSISIPSFILKKFNK